MLQFPHWKIPPSTIMKMEITMISYLLNHHHRYTSRLLVHISASAAIGSKRHPRARLVGALLPSRFDFLDGKRVDACSQPLRVNSSAPPHCFTVPPTGCRSCPSQLPKMQHCDIIFSKAPLLPFSALSSPLRLYASQDMPLSTPSVRLWPRLWSGLSLPDVIRLVYIAAYVSIACSFDY
jgi:hypothetical protein